MRWLERSTWTVLLLLVGLLSVEITVRIDDWAQHGVPLTEGANSLDDLMVRDSLGVHSRASTRFRQFRINSLGFRGAEVSARALDTAKVIVVSGASETFGLYESDGKEWPRQLEDSLAMRCGSGRRRAQSRALAFSERRTASARAQLRGGRQQHVVELA